MLSDLQDHDEEEEEEEASCDLSSPLCNNHGEHSSLFPSSASHSELIVSSISHITFYRLTVLPDHDSINHVTPPSPSLQPSHYVPARAPPPPPLLFVCVPVSTIVSLPSLSPSPASGPHWAMGVSAHKALMHVIARVAPDSHQRHWPGSQLSCEAPVTLRSRRYRPSSAVWWRFTLQS